MTGVSAQRPSSEEADNARREAEFGIAMAQHGLWREALFRFERARDFDPSYAEAFNNLGITYEQLGRLVEARQMYERALQLDPRNAFIKQNYRLFLEIDDRRTTRLPNTATLGRASGATASDPPRDPDAAP